MNPSVLGQVNRILGLLQFWRVLNEKNVQYIMMSGIAFRFHGVKRA